MNGTRNRPLFHARMERGNVPCSTEDKMDNKNKKSRGGGLSALKYVKGNKKNTFVVMIAIASAFMALYIINFLFSSTIESFKVICLEQPKSVAFVSLTDETMDLDETAESTNLESQKTAREVRQQEIIEKLKSHEGIEDAFFNQVIISNYNGVIGGYGNEMPLLEAGQIQTYIDHMGATLTEGRMPKSEGEVLVDEVILKNQKAKVGDYFQANSYGNTFKIVGSLKSDNMTCVGIPHGYYNNGWDFIILCDEENADMEKVFADIGIKTTKLDELNDVVRGADSLQHDIIDEVNGGLKLIYTVVSVILSISILVVYISFLRDRVNEYCLYVSIGFGKDEVLGMMIREILLIFGTAVVVGTILSGIIMVTLNATMIAPLGLKCGYLYPQYYLKLITILIAIIGIMQIPIAVTLKNVKTIDMMEE